MDWQSIFDLENAEQANASSATHTAQDPAATQETSAAQQEQPAAESLQEGQPATQQAAAQTPQAAQQIDPQMVAESLATAMAILQHIKQPQQQAIEEEYTEEEPPPTPPKRPEDPYDEKAWKEYLQQLAEYNERLAHYNSTRLQRRLEQLEQRLAEEEARKQAILQQQQQMARIYSQAVARGLSENDAREFLQWLSAPRTGLDDAIELFKLWKAQRSGAQRTQAAPPPPPPPPSSGARSAEPQAANPEDAIMDALMRIEENMKL